MVPEGGTMGQQMEFFFFSSFFSFSSTSFTPPNFFSLRYRKHQFSNWFDFPGNSFSFYFFEHICPENCPLLSGELSTDSRQSSDSYFSSVQSSPGLDIKLAQIWLTNKSQPWAGYKTGSLLLFVENRQTEFQNNIANSKIQVLTVQNIQFRNNSDKCKKPST